MLGGVAEVRDELFGHIAPPLLAFGERSGILGNGELKILAFGFLHQQNSAFVLRAGFGSIPVDDCSRYAATPHVGHLSSYLLTIVRSVADIAMVGIPKPRHVADIDAGL